MKRVSESVRLAVLCIWSRACASCSFSGPEFTETELMESRRSRERVGEMGEPEKEEPSRCFEVVRLLAMVEYQRQDGEYRRVGRTRSCFESRKRKNSLCVLCKDTGMSLGREKGMQFRAGMGRCLAWKHHSPPLRRLFPSEGASGASLAWWYRRNSEEKPLTTGGALQKALSLLRDQAELWRCSRGELFLCCRCPYVSPACNTQALRRYCACCRGRCRYTQDQDLLAGWLSVYVCRVV